METTLSNRALLGVVAPPPTMPIIDEDNILIMSECQRLTDSDIPFPKDQGIISLVSGDEGCDIPFSPSTSPDLTWFGEVSLEESEALSYGAPYPLPHGSYANLSFSSLETLNKGLDFPLPFPLKDNTPSGARITSASQYRVVCDDFKRYMNSVRACFHSTAAEYEKQYNFQIKPSKFKRSHSITPNTGDVFEERSSLWDVISTIYMSTRDYIISTLSKALESVLSGLTGLTSIVFNLVNNILNFLTNVTILSTQTVTGLTKGLLVANLVSNLGSFIGNLSGLLSRSGYTWSTNHATDAASAVADYLATGAESVADGLLVTPNNDPDITTLQRIKANISSFSPREWITAVVSSIVSILFAGLGLSKTLSPKDLASIGSSVRACRDVASTTTSVADFVSSKIVGLDMDHDLPKCEAVERLVSEGASLQDMSPSDFVQSSTDLCRLESYVRSIVDITSKPMQDKASKRYQTARSLLITIYRNLTQKIDTVRAILNTRPRQCTIGLVLSGPPGIGKSTFGKYFCRLLADKLGYKPSIYNLNHPKDGFYENYGGQDFGEYNEWMALRSDDPLLKDLNSIFSTDPMNFEAAALDGKHQPCRIKFAFITTNSDQPDLSRVLSEGAVAAVWDRLYHIRVDDPLCSGRNKPTPHRRPDFSHLRLRRVTHNRTNVTYSPISHATLLERMVGRVAASEREYLLSLLTSTGDVADPMNLPISQDLKCKLRLRLGQVEDLTAEYSPYDEDVIPNALGRDFFVIRLQGIPGSGKTTAAERVARELSLILGYEFQYSCTQEEFKPSTTKPIIYVLDDWVERSAYQKYLEQVNQTHRLSIFIIASNTVFTRYSKFTDISWLKQRLVTRMGYWFAGFPYVPSPWAVPGDLNIPMGVLRRIGLPGYIRLPSGELFDCPHAYSMNFTFGEYFIMRDHYDQILNVDSVLELVFMRYKIFLSQPGDFTIVKAAPPTVISPLAEIIADTASDVISAMRTVGGIGQAYAGRNPKVTFKLDPIRAYAANTAPTIANAWMIVEPPTNDPTVMQSIFSRMCASFSRMAPDQSFLLKIMDTATTYYYYKGVGYIYSETETIQSVPIEFGDRFVDIRRPDELVRVTAHEFVAWRLFRQLGSNISKLSLAELRLLGHHFESLSSLPNSIPGFRTNVELIASQQARQASPAWLAAKASLNKHPAFWLGCGLLSIFCVGAGAVALYQLIRYVQRWALKKTDEPNTHPYERMHGRNAPRGAPDRIERYHKPPRNPAIDRWNSQKLKIVANKLQPNDPIFIDEWCELASKFSQLQVDEPDLTFEEFIDRVVSDRENPYFTIQNMINEDPTAKQALLEHPAMSSVVTNMLAANDMILQDESRVEKQHRALTKCYYKLVREDGACCYAIALRGNLLLTVSHLFDKVGQSVTVVSDGLKFTARALRLYRDRDLAVVHVTDKEFPSAPNTRHLFAPADLMHNASQGFFIRPGPVCQVMGGRVTFYDYVAYPLSCRDKNYDPREKFIVWTAVGCESMRDFIKRGDCGFPLLVNDHSGSVRIIALHNAFNEREKAYFSGVCQTDWDEYARPVVTPNLDSDSDFSSDEELLESNGKLDYIRIKDTGALGYMPSVFAAGLAEGFMPSKWDHCTDRLDVLGQCERLKFRSRPRNAHHLIDRDYLKTPLVVLPAAVDLTWVIDTSKLAHDAFGTPSPLFTQCLKYDKTVPWSYEKEIFQRSVALVSEECQYYYGKLRVLRLHECVNGVFKEPLSSLDPHTSAGPYFKHVFGITNKVPLLKRVDEDTIIIDTSIEPGVHLKNQYYDYIKRINDEHIGPLILSKDCAKVELLPAYKATEGKVRLFNEVDLSVNLVLRTYFGDFVNQAMKQHRIAPIRVGFNPYVDATHIMRQFNQIDGTIISTDFSAFDKQLPPCLIMAFCSIVADMTDIPGKTPEEVAVIYAALARSLTHVLHTTDGTIYVVDRGNESGTFVTTVLNSVAVWILTYYTVIRKWHEVHGEYPTAVQIRTETRQAILGDDRSFKTSKALPITEQDFICDSKLFGLVCTPAKSGRQLDFCSRSFHWDEIEQVCYPPLKNTSILGQMRWYSSLAPQQVLDNVTNALYEAALHPSDTLYKLIYHDACLLLRDFGFSLEETRLHSREKIRRDFVENVRNDGLDPLSGDQPTYEEETPAQYIDRVKRSYTKRFIKPISSQESLVEVSPKDLFTPLDFVSLVTDMSSNPKGALFELLQNKRVTVRPIERIEEGRDEANKPLFTHHLEFMGHTTVGSGYSKSTARDSAYGSMLTIIREHTFDTPNVDDLPDRADQAATKNGKAFLYRSVMEHLRIATKVAQALAAPVTVLITKAKETTLITESVSGYRYDVDNEGAIYCLSKTSQYFNYKDMAAIYLMQPGTCEVSERILVGASDTVPNMDKPVTGVQVDGTQDNPGMSTIPTLPNPISTRVLPAQATNEPAAVGALEPLIPHEDLNPTGAPNMLGVGAIEFDLKDLVYSQFIDSDVEYTYTDGSPQGTIVFQIPYDPTSAYVNPYIRQYVSLHQRYAGALLFRVTIVGNATYSGIVGMAWQPAKVAGTVAKISELHKYSYFGKNITLPDNEVMVLHDARKQFFYREVSDTDVDTRPHLVCYVHMTAVSPLREGITIRIRIASKLATAADGVSPFQVALPTLPAGGGTASYSYVGPKFDISSLLTGQPLYPIVLRSFDSVEKNFYAAIDGNIFPTYILPSADTDYTTTMWDASPRPGICVTSPGMLVYSTLASCNAVAWLDTTGADDQHTYGVNQVRLLDFSKTRLRFSRATLRDIFSTSDPSELTGLDEFRNAVVANLGDAKALSSAGFLPAKPADPTLGWTVVSGGGPRRTAVRVNGEEQSCLLFTTYGVIRLAYYATNPADRIEVVDTLSTELLFDDANYCNAHTQCNSYVSYADNEAMPSGWRHITFSADIPYVAAQGIVGRLSVPHASLYGFLSVASEGVTANEVVQIEVNDIDSARLLFTAWYLPDRKVTVVNVSGNRDELMYATSLRPMNRAYITRLSRLPRTSSFPETDLANFADNQVHLTYQSYMHRPRIYYPDQSRVYPNANLGPILAASGGGWLSGIGQGLGQAANAWQNSEEAAKNRQLQKELQQYEWAQKYGLNDANWRYGLEAQGRNYVYESLLSGQSYRQDYAAAQGLAQQRQELAGYRTPGAQYALNATANSSSSGGTPSSSQLQDWASSRAKRATSFQDFKPSAPGYKSISPEKPSGPNPVGLSRKISKAERPLPNITTPISTTNKRDLVASSPFQRNQPGRQPTQRKVAPQRFIESAGPSGFSRPKQSRVINFKYSGESYA